MHRVTRSAGFTLIEITVVVGIVMILIGLTLPGLAQSRELARLTRDMTTIRGMCHEVFAYAQDFHDYFPTASANPISSLTRAWHDALVSSGHAGNAHGLMPSSNGGHRVYMAGGAFLPPGAFDPAAPQRWIDRTVLTQRVQAVAHPSSKGLLFRATRTDGELQDRSTWWCCTPLNTKPSPVIFGDGSGVLIGWLDLRSDNPTVSATFQGYPVISTWMGVLGRDR